MTEKDSQIFFIQGLIELYQQNYQQADSLFFEASQLADYETQSRYLSYQGLAQVLNNQPSGVRNCYPEFQVSDVEISLNKAMAEYIMGNRKRSITATKEISESKKNKMLLDSFYKLTGHREKNKKGDYKRLSMVNQSFGKYRRKEALDIDVKQINQCIQHQIDILYKPDILKFKQTQAA